MTRHVSPNIYCCVPSRLGCNSRRCLVHIVRASSRFQDTECHIAETKKELNVLLQNLGFPKSVLPGEAQVSHASHALKIDMGPLIV